MKKCGIYGLRNPVNGKWYVGQSVDLEGRRLKHLSELRRIAHYNQHLQSAFKQNGEKAFEFHVLEELSEDMLDIRECYWIDHYNSLDPRFGYNLESGGHALKHHSAETRRKTSLALKGRVTTLETRRKLSAALKGRVLSDAARDKNAKAHIGLSHSIETRQKMSSARSGKVLSADHRRKLSEAQRRRAPISEETRRKMVESHKGQSRPCLPETRLKLSAARKGKPSSRPGYRHSQETRRKMSEALKRKHQMSKQGGGRG